MDGIKRNLYGLDITFSLPVDVNVDLNHTSGARGDMSKLSFLSPSMIDFKIETKKYNYSKYDMFNPSLKLVIRISGMVRAPILSYSADTNYVSKRFYIYRFSSTFFTYKFTKSANTYYDSDIALGLTFTEVRNNSSNSTVSGIDVFFDDGSVTELNNEYYISQSMANSPGDGVPVVLYSGTRTYQHADVYEGTYIVPTVYNKDNVLYTSNYILRPALILDSTSSANIQSTHVYTFPGYRLYTYGGYYDYNILVLNVSDDNNVRFIVSDKNFSYDIFSEERNLYSYPTINDTIYQTKLPDNPEDAIDIKIKGNGKFVNQNLSINTYLDGYWFAIGNKVYRNKYTVDENGNWQLYIPENNYEEFETDVTGLMTISTDTVAAFTDNAVYTSAIVGQDENGNNIYGKFIKSKFNLGNKSFSDILTTYDGKYTLFNTMRGLAGMSFQDFINSTDQALTFLSEPIYSQYFEFVQKPVLMTLYKYWLYCYHNDDTVIWILDFRTSSWWKYEVNKPIQKIIIYNDEIYFLQNGALSHFDYSTDYYYDEYRDTENSASPDFIEHSQINWSLTSQKLYLGSIDRYKTVKDITIYNVQDDERDINFVLDCKNYRHHIDDGKEEWIEYNVSKIRTFVKRLHYSKVREFQYTLRNDPNAQIQSPMKISNIAIKYHVGDEVR